MIDDARRRFLRTLAAAGLAPLSACRLSRHAAGKARVVVVGGGFGGATFAKTLRFLDPDLRIALIEPKNAYMTCPGSNWLFAGQSTPTALQVDYQALSQRYNIDVVQDRAKYIDSSRRRLHLAGGTDLAYDRLLLAPGIAFDWEAIAGYDVNAAARFPHAWQAGPQTQLLLRQMQAMPDGGVLLIAAPPDPYRCPPGPYERASMMAHWLKRHKPRSKILILDPKRSFSKQALFEAGWRRHYGYGTAHSLIEWHSLADNPIVRLDAAGKTVVTEFGDRFSGHVLNIIPPQTAGRLAVESGLTDASGWCPVLPATSQSPLDPFIHVIGDAAQLAPIPKSAFAANSAAKTCALAVTALLNDREPGEAGWLNICYSLVAPDHGISIAGVYRLDSSGRIAAVPGAGGVSDSHLPDAAEREALYAKNAYRSLIADSFG
ncbi:NAD(P)/FAD-dependent oxidoreductase [Methylomonas rhizoryzae]|uniref:NAD(P)/FAD-dependent oxidoreductase n=1 Tax=Methylomonas rhizoryzae TaxID=2608981 RepID=UPI001231B6C2|nr:NAD(P)/FAD-dependent oxidoreductase [Methylomonas rhizoryzae]